MTTETEIANLAIQQCGATRIADGALWTEDSKQASEIRACYDQIRKVELRRNCWRYSIRSEVLRKRTATTKAIFFADYDPLVYYQINDRIRRNGRSWICIGEGIGHDPNDRTYDYWTSYFGSDTADVYSATETYRIGEQVYVGDDGYISVADENLGNVVTNVAYFYPLSVAAFDSFKIYEVGQRVSYGGSTYRSLQNNNQGKVPNVETAWWVSTSSQRLRLSAFNVPTASGLNLFRRPTGYMREAPQNPKQGSYTPSGAPSAPYYKDWLHEGGYFKTMEAGPIDYRFGCDIMEPDLMDPMFVNLFSNRLAFTVCEAITQSKSKLDSIGGAYQKFGSEARIVNAIETGPVEAPEDSYITTRD